MGEVVIDGKAIERFVEIAHEPSGENHRQLLGLRLVKTLADLGVLVVRDLQLLNGIASLDEDPTNDPRFGWPSSRTPDSVELTWPAPKLPREPLEERHLRLSPWAFHSLMLGDWNSPIPGTVVRLPECVSLLFCDGLTENPMGRDLLRVTGRLEVLSLPTQLHSQILVCGLADGLGGIEVELQVVGPNNTETGFAIKPVLCPARDVATFYIASLDKLEIQAPGRYWFALRVLGEEISRLPIEVSDREGFISGGWEFGQSWIWEGEVFFGERE
jgi:hypothetical protein